MNSKITRRTAVRSLAAGSAALAFTNNAQAATHENTETLFALPQGKRGERGAWMISFRVIAADNFSPVSDVEVEFNWWGTDGGVRIYNTDADGILTFSETFNAYNPRQQVYYLNFSPPKHSRFAKSSATITINADGSYFPNQFTLPFHETELEGMKIYAEKRS